MEDEMLSLPLRRIEATLRSMMHATTTRRAHGRWAREAGIDLTFIPFRILETACESDALRISVIANALDIDSALVSREVNHLEEEGLIIRTLDDSDGRVRLISATPRGKSIYRRYRATLRKNLEPAISQWTDGELDQLAVLLERFVRDVTQPFQP